MKRFMALSYVLGLPVVLGFSTVVPTVVFGLLFATGFVGLPGVLVGSFGFPGTWMIWAVLFSPLFRNFFSNFFTATDPVLWL